MSVINQVLNQLEQRGELASLKQNMVRVVPHVRRKNIYPALTVAGVLLLVGLGTGLWWAQGSDSNSVKAAQPAMPISMPVAVAPISGDALVSEVSGVLVAVTEESADSLSESDSMQVDAPLSVESSPVAAPSRSGEVRRKPEPSQVVQVREVRKESVKKREVVTQAVPVSSVPMKQVSTAQQADAEFRRGLAAMQQGRRTEAIASYEAALHLDAAHDAARQALVALLLESRRGLDAERVLQQRLDSKPGHTGFAMLLARQQVERGEVDMALATLERSLSFADGNADYRAFFAALLQRSNRHVEAVAHYQAALKLQPDNGVWLMGYGISLQALQRDVEAKAAFQRALDSKTLSPELQAFVQKRLKGP